ncbi:MAG: hypothetical protein M9962_10700 [Oligoflexia bacterium]|nr:hypothetical protein [Oligoflexia bacterium]
MKSIKLIIVAVVAIAGFTPSAFSAVGQNSKDEMNNNHIKCAYAEQLKKQVAETSTPAVNYNNDGSGSTGTVKDVL